MLIDDQARHTDKRYNMVQVISAPLQPSLCETGESDSRQLRVGLYQMKWYDDASEHLQQLHAGVAACAHAATSSRLTPASLGVHGPGEMR